MAASPAQENGSQPDTVTKPAAAALAAATTTTHSQTPQAAPPDQEELGIEDLALPRTLIQRLAKGALPAQTQLQKDALLALSKSTTVFINMLAAEAAALACSNGKRTIQPADVLLAVEQLEFPAFAPRMQGELEVYQKIKSGKRSMYREKVKEREQALAANTGEQDPPTPTAAEAADSEGARENQEGASERRREGGGDPNQMVDIDSEPAAKKRRQDIHGTAMVDVGGDMMDEDDEDGPDEEEGEEEEGEGEEEGLDEEDEDEEEEDEEEEDEMDRVADVGDEGRAKSKGDSRRGLSFGARGRDGGGAEEDDEDEDE